MKPSYEPYQAKRILNAHQHVDGGWFWDKYSAHPYVGCQFGCEFCYLREPRYSPYEDPDDFSKIVRIKANAPALLRKELSRVPKDIIVTGDYQPVEARFRLSKQLLEICLEFGFPVLIIERSPLVLRDLDIIQAISEKSWACVLFSVSSAHSEGYREVFEPHAPRVEARFRAMRQVAAAGVPTGVAFMPILPFICDSDENLQAVVRATKEHGGGFVIAGGLTLSGYQMKRYMALIKGRFPHVVSGYDSIYDGEVSTHRKYLAGIARKVRQYCEDNGVLHRMPRYVPPGEFATNKRVAERLFLAVYEMETSLDSSHKIWAYRKAAWTIDELDARIEEIYRERGMEGLRAIPGIGTSLASTIATILEDVRTQQTSLVSSQ